MKKISHSDVDNFKLCKRRAFYSWGKQLEPLKRSDSLNRGILFHEVMESFFKSLIAGDGPAIASVKGEKRINKAIANMEFDIAIIAQTKEMYFYFNEWWVNEEPFNGWEFLESESKYLLPYTVAGEEVGYPFTIDLLAKDPNGDLVLLDLKTTRNFYSNDWIDLSSQLPKYAKALEVLGRGDIKYCGYLQIRNYYRKDATYDEVVKFTPFEVSETRKNRSLFEQLEASRDLVKGIPEETAVRTANNLVCQSCPFKDLCISDLNGYDTDLLIQTNYTTKEDRYSDIGGK